VAARRGDGAADLRANQSGRRHVGLHHRPESVASHGAEGLVGHRECGKTYAYFAKVEREHTFQAMAGGFLDKVFRRAVDEYLVHALQSRRISVAELERLEKMIAEAKKSSKKRKKGEAS